MYSVSNNSLVIYGTNAGPFKLGICATATRRRKVQVIQLARAKPEVAEVTAELELFNASPNVPIGGWSFETFDKTLLIENTEAITGIVPADVSTSTIPMTANPDIPPEIITSFFLKKTPITP